MTFEELQKMVEKQIRYIQEKLADSPVSACSHLNRGIGFVEAVCSMKGYDGSKLVEQLEEEIRKQKLV